jgi:hypothetical protein
VLLSPVPSLSGTQILRIVCLLLILIAITDVINVLSQGQMVR